MGDPLNQQQAEQIAKAVWGKQGFAYEQRRFTGNEQPGDDGWIKPQGELYGYSVGYHRTGKRGARLSTQKGHGKCGFEEAFRNAVDSMVGTDKRYGKLRDALNTHYNEGRYA